MIALSITLLLFLLLAIGTPIAFAMIISSALGLLWVGGLPTVLGILTTTPHATALSYELLTIPMFLLMAELLLRSGIASDLFEAIAAWVGRIPGGLGIATALAGAGFGAICGSSTASAVTLSSTSLPAMLKAGYDGKIASGVIAISGTLSMLIPPSIALIIYAFLADQSVAKLLIAGIVPGIIVTITIALTTVFLALRNPKLAPRSAPISLGHKLRLLKVIWPMMALIMSVTGVIYTGIATPTEASALGALTAAGFFFLLGRGTSLHSLFEAIAKALRTTCMIILILIGAHMFSTFFALTQTTQSLVTAISGLELSPWIILMVIVAIYILLGTFMDQIGVLVLTVPVALPLITSLGFDPIWFGVIIVVAAELGLVTPPVGLNCFVVAKYANRPLEEVFLGVMPHVVFHLFALTLLIAFPALTLWLPNKMF